MESKVKIPFAKKNGRVVHINEVENGLACDCYCCKCGAQLVAKNNVSNIKEAHFAHYNSEDCGKALETSIHQAAKQLLLQTKKIVLPDILYYDKSNEVTFKKVELEKTFPYDIRADALGYINNIDKVIIEFAFTHFTDEKKKQKFNKLKIPAIEVSLNRLCLSFDDIEKILLSSGYKEWLYYSLQDNPEINSIVKKYKNEISSLNNNIESLTNENVSKISSLKNSIDSLINENLSLKNEKLSLEEKIKNYILENVKLKRNIRGYKA